MDSGVPVGASSSASAKEYFPFRMTISEIEQTAPGVWKIMPSGGSAFFLREDYLSSLPADTLEEARFSTFPLEFPEAAYKDLLSAALCYSAEQMAMDYLARAEQYRRSLTAKLSKKGHDSKDIERALDYLEGKGYLDDRRFAGAWLRSRAINHAEGRLRLGAELSARGISRSDANAALDEFFSDHDENALCRKALERTRKFCTVREKIIQSLIRKGFTTTQIRTALDNESNILS